MMGDKAMTTMTMLGGRGASTAPAGVVMQKRQASGSQLGTQDEAHGEATRSEGVTLARWWLSLLDVFDAAIWERGLFRLWGEAQKLAGSHRESGQRICSASEANPANYVTAPPRGGGSGHELAMGVASRSFRFLLLGLRGFLSVAIAYHVSRQGRVCLRLRPGWSNGRGEREHEAITLPASRSLSWVLVLRVLVAWRTRLRSCGCGRALG